MCCIVFIVGLGYFILDTFFVCLFGVGGMEETKSGLRKKGGKDEGKHDDDDVCVHKTRQKVGVQLFPKNCMSILSPHNLRYTTPTYGQHTIPRIEQNQAKRERERERERV